MVRLRTRLVLPGFSILLAFGVAAIGRQALAQEQATAEMSAHETVLTFRTRTNLVLVPVVVRDGQGRPIGNLLREDFELFDQGKPQTITKFSMETTVGEPLQERAANAVGPAARQPAALPERYVAFLFDDLHLSVEDLTRAREAAARHLANSPGASVRTAIFTTSGQTTLGFTDDRQRSLEALASLRPHPAGGALVRDCPDLSAYQADRIVNRNDQTALDAATLETVVCAPLDPTGPAAKAVMEQAQRMAQIVAQRAVAAGENGAHTAVEALRGVVRVMAGRPGRRVIVLVSPGFLRQDARQELAPLIDAAARESVIVDALDARGLSVMDPVGDASDQSRLADPKLLRLLGRDTIDVSGTMQTKQLRAAALAEADTLATLADGTGGTFFHNSNDLELGFRRAGDIPAYRYVLGFTPERLESDGRFHALKVTLRNSNGASVQARRGYVAPSGPSDPAETAKREIEDEVFSREELHDIPAEVHTQFFKRSDDRARLSVLVRVNVKELPYLKEGGRHRDELTVVSALFDQNGNYVAGKQQTIEMRLSDETLAGGPGPPVAVKLDFDVAPGAYIVRVVVRDAQGMRMAAENSVTEIPW